MTFYSIVFSEQVLTERDVIALLNLIHNFSDKWNEIGLGLGFTPPELNQIISNPSLFMSAPTSFLTKLLSQWVQWPTMDHPIKPTLCALCETLRSSLVGLGSLAEKVEREMKCSMAGKEPSAVQVAAGTKTEQSVEMIRTIGKPTNYHTIMWHHPSISLAYVETLCKK